MKLYKDKPMDPPPPPNAVLTPLPAKKWKGGGAPGVLFSTILKKYKIAIYSKLWFLYIITQ